MPTPPTPLCHCPRCRVSRGLSPTAHDDALRLLDAVDALLGAWDEGSDLGPALTRLDATRCKLGTLGAELQPERGGRAA